MKQFGSWIVTNDSIEWKGAGFNRFVIGADELTQTASRGELDRTVYEWILRATNEDWLSQDDLYDLNYAFVFAAATFGLDFDYDVFDDTLAEQFDIFDAEDDEDVDSDCFSSN